MASKPKTEQKQNNSKLISGPHQKGLRLWRFVQQFLSSFVMRNLHNLGKRQCKIRSVQRLSNLHKKIRVQLVIIRFSVKGVTVHFPCTNVKN